VNLEDGALGAPHPSVSVRLDIAFRIDRLQVIGRADDTSVGGSE